MRRVNCWCEGDKFESIPHGDLVLCGVADQTFIVREDIGRSFSTNVYDN
jgi:hypothetical protein